MRDTNGGPADVTTQFQWRRTNAPAARRFDDIWFIDAQVGWGVNSNGHILHTRDGGNTWVRQFSTRGAYLRCVGFADAQQGWVGTVTASRRMFRTRDGGATWTQVTDLPPEAPPSICGLSVVNERVLYASGTNFPDRPTGVIKSVDGGATWTGRNMADHATLLVDIYFENERRGWVVGGKADVPNPDRDDVIPVVLFTEDGGQTWVNRLAGMEAVFPRGEWGWKIQFLSDRVGYVSLENFGAAAILQTTDGGRTWRRIEIRDAQGNANLEGIGFLDETVGWVGGWGDRQGEAGFSSETRDGGSTWTDANHIGRFLNRFRFLRVPELVGYASGDTVYKYASVPVSPAPEPVAAAERAEEEPLRARLPLRIPVEVRPGDPFLRVDIWDRFAGHVATPIDEDRPEPGYRDVVWDPGDPRVLRRSGGILIYRVTIGDRAESHFLRVEE